MSRTTPNETLAIEGGTPVRETETSSWPQFQEDEIQAVTDVLQSGEVNQWTGESVQQFEKAFSKYVGTEYAVAVSNGTVALELALRALGISEGDEVIVPSRTFIGTASAVDLAGATPVVADIEVHGGNLTADTITEQITERTAAIVPVHTLGWPCEMDAIINLAYEHDLYIVEDCAQAHGATYKGEIVGSIGDVGCFSFCQDKILTTGGEGGMVLTDDEEVWRRAWEYKDHGKNYEAIFEEESTRGFDFVHDRIGTNWRMTSMQAAIGRTQLDKLPDWLSLRKRNANFLLDALREIPGIRAETPTEHIDHAWYKFQAHIEPERLANGWDRDRVVAAISAEGVPCFEGLCSEIYLEEALIRNGHVPSERFPNAKSFGETSIMFLVHPTLTISEMGDVAVAVRKVINSAHGEER